MPSEIPDKATQQRAEWPELKKDLRYFGYTDQEADAMTYSQFIENREVHGLDIFYSLRVWGRVVHITWDEWMADDSIDYYPSNPFLHVARK